MTAKLQAVAQNRGGERPLKSAASCHGALVQVYGGAPRIAIVGGPNVGKSVLFNALTGAYVTVSNFPGTTVEVSRGKGHLGGTDVEIIDTPGMYRLLPITEEERVARDILLCEEPDVVVHVVDAKNLDRMLPLTLQLIEAGLPVVLDINLMDEAVRLGISIDATAFEEALGVPVVLTTLTSKEGLGELVEAIGSMIARGRGEVNSKSVEEPIRYPLAIEQALAEIQELLHNSCRLSDRATALLLLQQDKTIIRHVEERDGQSRRLINEKVKALRKQVDQPLPLLIAQSQRESINHFLDLGFRLSGRSASSFAQRISDAMMRPLTGVPILLVSMFLLYELVGVFGAGFLVDFLETRVFEAIINPWVNQLLVKFVPWTAVQQLIGGEYGMVTLGVRYAVALILPIVGTFFLAFSLIEDSGYLPRLAMLIDRVFKRIGLSGRAAIPMVLGLGCDTMATIVTRTLETRRERVLSTFLLALAVPCSAQLGVMLGLMAGEPKLVLIWASVVISVFLLTGFLAAQILPGERPSFYMELPPLRWPRLGNILVKTYTRMEWYFREVFPLFIAASVLIWLGQLTGLFELALTALRPLVGSVFLTKPQLPSCLDSSAATMARPAYTTCAVH